MTRKNLIKKFIETVRGDLKVYSKYIKEGKMEEARYVHFRIITRIDFARELGLVPADYYLYLLRKISS